MSKVQVQVLDCDFIKQSSKYIVMNTAAVMTGSSCCWSWNAESQKVREQHTLEAWQLHGDALQDASGCKVSSAWESLHETQGSFSTSV